MRISRLVTALFAIVLVFTGLTGCATLSRKTAFDVTLVNLSRAEATALESRVIVTLRYTNEANTPLSLTGSRHKLSLNGRTVGIAVSPEALEVPALSTVTQDVTLNVSHIALIGLLREVHDSRSVRYQLDSTLYLGRASRGLSATHSGTIDLQALANASAAY